MKPTLDFTQDGLRHRKWVFPAFFCGVKNCCEGKPVDKYSSHGISTERWLYVVGDDPYAVSMEVSTGQYLPETHEPDQPPKAWDMSWHRRSDDPITETCLCLSLNPCRSDGTSLGAHEWYEEQQKKVGTVTDDHVFTFLRTDLYPNWQGE